MEYPIEQLTLIRDATEVLGNHFSFGVVVDSVELIKDGERAQTFRLHIANPSVKVPPSIIAKRIKASSSQAELGYNDWGSLQFLSAARRTRALAPRFFGGSKSAGVYCIEDLGESADIEAGWREDGKLDGVFINHARISAELAASTSLREAEFEHVITELPVAALKRRYADADAWRGRVTKFREWLTALGVAERDELPAEILKIVQSFEEPGKLLAFTHGDFAPSNLHVDSDSGSVHILDFEHGGYRNALYDLTAWNILCPLREELVSKLREVFRTEFVKRYEFTVTESEVDRAWVTMSLYRAIAMFGWIGTEIIDQDKPWVGEWSCRLALLAAASRGRNSAAESPEFSALHATFADIASKLKQRWADIRN